MWLSIVSEIRVCKKYGPIRLYARYCRQPRADSGGIDIGGPTREDTQDSSHFGNKTLSDTLRIILQHHIPSVFDPKCLDAHYSWPVTFANHFFISLHLYGIFSAWQHLNALYAIARRPTVLSVRPSVLSHGWISQNGLSYDYATFTISTITIPLVFKNFLRGIVSSRNGNGLPKGGVWENKPFSALNVYISKTVWG